MTVRKHLDDLIQKTKNPVAIFDLDGTLFDVTYRSLEILKRFINEPNVKAKYPEQTRLAHKIKHKDFHYSLESTLYHFGFDRYSELSASFVHDAENFWFKHFFTDALLSADVPYPGALQCVRHLYEKGVHIVYLSGRDIPNMSIGTINALESGGFPHTGERISMILKPAYGQDDLLFKKQAVQTISQTGNVIFTIDNEPANVQMFSDSFEHAHHVHFHTLYAKDIPLKGRNLHIAKSFGDLGFHD